MKKIAFAAFAIVLSATFCHAEEIPLMELKKFDQALIMVYNLYVDSVQASTLTENAIEGMLKELDPHSTYIPAKEVEKMNAQIDGSFEGIGIQFQMFNDTLLVIQTIAGCPAERVGLLPSDRIISVDGENIAGVKKQTSDIMSLIRGKAGTRVAVQVKRNGVANPIDFIITRGPIPVYSLDAAYMITPKIGYVKLNSFSATTSDEFEKALKNLKKQGMKQLLLDLQGNGGGLMQAAIELADNFLENGQLVVYTQGLHQRPSKAFASAWGNLDKTDVVVLVDEYSASASEIVAGALQDWDRAVIVGRRTFGKGLVQKPIPLIDGSLIRLTVSRYYTPSGRNIQKSYADGIDKYHKDLEERYKHGELLSADSINLPDSLQYKTLRLGRTVYGGGGIMPDIFVPLDTNRTTNYHRNIVAKGILNKTVIEFIEQNRKTLETRYTKFDTFNNKFIVDDDLLQQLTDNASAANIAYNEAEFEQSKQLISLQIKALIARDLFDDGDYYRIMNAENDIVKRGIDVLENYQNYLK